MGFNPAQLAQASMIGSVGGGITSAIGAFSSAQSQKSSLKAQAAISDTNARIAEMSAQSVLSAGQKEVAKYTLQAGNVKGKQRASMAANGIDLGVGNAAETLASTEIIKEIDKNQIEANSIRSAWGLRTQSTNYQNDSMIKRATAGSISPFAAGATSLLNSATSVASSWYNYNKTILKEANQSSDPIESLGTAKGWW